MTSATSSGTATAGPIARLRKPWLLLVALLSLGAASATSASDYYFSSAGNDASGDGSLAKPWQSVAKFNQLTLHPGDSALFRAGDVFSGKMYLDAADSGTNASGQFIAPVKIGSYGATGTATRAKIVSPVNTEGFVAYNDGGIELSDLEFASGGVTGGQRTNGVQFISDKAASASLPAYQHIRVNNVVSHGFGMNGLQVWAHVGVGFSDVKVTNSEFYDNGYSGVYVGGTQWHGKYHSNVTIDHVVSHDNPGFSSKELPYTGNGIILAQTNGGLLQNSVGYGNGKLHGNSNGAIWIYGSDSIVVQHNLAYGNRSPDGYDGGAYDVDGGTTNSVFQYNRSYDNDGAGMLLAEYNGADPMANNVYRYNLSVNDGKGAYGGITIWGNDSTRLAQSAVFHNNTVVVDRNFSSTVKGAVWFLGGNHKNVELINNTFVALNGAPLIAGDTSTSQSSIIGNSYWTAGGKIILEDQTYCQCCGLVEYQPTRTRGRPVHRNYCRSQIRRFRPLSTSSLFAAHRQRSATRHRALARLDHEPRQAGSRRSAALLRRGTRRRRLGGPRRRRFQWRRRRRRLGLHDLARYQWIDRRSAGRWKSEWRCRPA